MTGGALVDEQIRMLWESLAGLTEALLPPGIFVSAPPSYGNQWAVGVREGTAATFFYGSTLKEALAAAGVNLAREGASDARKETHDRQV